MCGLGWEKTFDNFNIFYAKAYSEQFELGSEMVPHIQISDKNKQHHYR